MIGRDVPAFKSKFFKVLRSHGTYLTYAATFLSVSTGTEFHDPRWTFVITLQPNCTCTTCSPFRHRTWKLYRETPPGQQALLGRNRTITDSSQHHHLIYRYPLWSLLDHSRGPFSATVHEAAATDVFAIITPP